VNAEREATYKQMRVSGNDIRSDLPRVLGHAERPIDSILAHGSRGLATLGLFAAVNDVYGAFKEGPAAGMGRLAKVGTEWGGYEIGARAASLALGSVAGRFKVLTTLATMATGFAGSYAANAAVGESLETKIKKLS
jgi:hypothetical protein